MPTVGIKRDLLYEALGREYSKSLFLYCFFKKKILFI